MDPILDCIAEEDEEIELEDEEVAAVTTSAAADSEEEQLPKKKKKKKRKKLKAADDILDFAANKTCAEAWSYFRLTECFFNSMQSSYLNLFVYHSHSSFIPYKI